MRNCLNQKTQTWKEFVLHHPAHFLPTPYKPRAWAGLFISKVIVTFLEQLFIQLKEDIVRKSSHIFELDALFLLIQLFSTWLFFLSLPSNGKACTGTEPAGGVHERYLQGSIRKGFPALFRGARKAANMREKQNKYTAGVICLQDLCQLQVTILPVIFKGFDGRKSA